MDPAPVREITAELDDSAAEAEIQGVSGAETAERLDTFVLSKKGL